MSTAKVPGFVRRNRAAAGGIAAIGVAMAASIYVQGPNSPELTLSDVANMTDGNAITVVRSGPGEAAALRSRLSPLPREVAMAEARRSEAYVETDYETPYAPAPGR